MPVQFVTVCTHGRRPILANREAYASLLSAWESADGWIVGKYVVMPDHVHLFCAPATWQPPYLAKWIAYWKSLAARSFPEEISRPIWQREYWDRLLRSNESYSEKWAYVELNPVRKGLVMHASSWEFSGEINVLDVRG